jgi:hypothetical protein
VQGMLMKRAIAILVLTGFMLLIAGDLTGTATTPPPGASPASADLVAPLLPGIQPCLNPRGVIRAFYDANDAGNSDASLALLTPDANLTTYAEGVNGRHWKEITLSGEQIRGVLGRRGLRRDSGIPDQPVFHETEFKLTENQAFFMLRPDRTGPGGRQYDPYEVTAVFLGCKIKSLTVVERFTVP